MFSQSNLTTSHFIIHTWRTWKYVTCYVDEGFITTSLVAVSVFSLQMATEKRNWNSLAARYFLLSCLTHKLLSTIRCNHKVSTIGGVHFKLAASITLLPLARFLSASRYSSIRSCRFSTRCFPFQYLSMLSDCRVLTMSYGLIAVSWLMSVIIRNKI